MTSPTKLTRRSIVLAGALGGAGLLVGFPLPAMAGRESRRRSTEEFRPNAFLRISPDGRVTTILGASEMGQGIHTALAMVVADELDADWNTIGVEAAPADPVYGNPILQGLQASVASVNVLGFYDTLRHAAAAARMMLVEAAAAEWGVPASDCHAFEGAVKGPDGRHRSYGDLASAAARLKPPTKEAVRLKDPKDFKFIGRSMSRLGGREQVTGQTVYGLDHELPGTLTAMVARAPQPGARVESYDRKSAAAIEGVRAIVEIPTGVAVIADHFWAASHARELLRVQWNLDASAQYSSAALEEHYRQLLNTPGTVAASSGDASGILRESKDAFTAEYSVPFLAHSPMEPLNCTVQLASNRCDVWVGSQYQSMDSKAVARVLGWPESRIHIHTTAMGGGFGRRGSPDSDVVAETAEIAKAARNLRVPIKNVWAREDDIRGGYYRPMGLNLLSATLNEAGLPHAWLHRVVTKSQLSNSEFDFFVSEGIDAASVAGARDLPYSVPNLHVELHSPERGPTVQWMRSVGNSNVCFAVEGFVDELAHRARMDPVEYRRRLLAGKSESRRLLNVLEVVADESGWGQTLPAGRARGVAVHDFWGTKVAQVAEVSVQGNRLHVHRVTCAVDCGSIVNPDGVRAQMEGGILFGLTAALYGEITFTNGQVDQSNFHDYPLLRMDAAPEIDVHLIRSSEAPGGVGEVAVPHIAPAICNAIYAACGRRIRKLPLSASGLEV